MKIVLFIILGLNIINLITGVLKIYMVRKNSTLKII